MPLPCYPFHNLTSILSPAVLHWRPSPDHLMLPLLLRTCQGHPHCCSDQQMEPPSNLLSSDAKCSTSVFEGTCFLQSGCVLHTSQQHYLVPNHQNSLPQAASEDTRVRKVGSAVSALGRKSPDLQKLLNFSVPQFPPVENGDNNSSYLLRLVGN